MLAIQSLAMLRKKFAHVIQNIQSTNNTGEIGLYWKYIGCHINLPYYGLLRLNAAQTKHFSCQPWGEVGRCSLNPHPVQISIFGQFYRYTRIDQYNQLLTQTIYYLHKTIHISPTQRTYNITGLLVVFVVLFHSSKATVASIPWLFSSF